MSKQDNFDRFPFILAGDDSDALPAWLGNPDVPELDSDFDGPREMTAADLDALAYGRAWQGLI